MLKTPYFTPKRIVRFLIILSCIVLVIIFNKLFATALLPFIIGIILAAFLEPIIVFLQKHLKIPRTIAILTTLTLSVVLIGYILVTSTAKMITELVDLVNRFPQYQQTITRVINEAVTQFEVFNENLPQVVSNSINHNLTIFFETVKNWVNAITSTTINAFSLLPSFFIVTIFTIVSTYFFSKDKAIILEAFLKFIPENWKARVRNTLDIIAVDLVGYIKGKLIVLLLATVIAAVGLVLLNNRYWMILAIIIGLLDLAPIVGPGLIFGPWVVITFLLGDIQKAIFLSLIYMAIFIANQVLEPKIMGDTVGIHPLIMMVAFYAGYIFFGAMGLFIGPLSVIVLRAAINAGLFQSLNFPE